MENTRDVMPEEMQMKSPDVRSSALKETSTEAILSTEIREAENPRTIELTRSSHFGFGFTLRHFIVYPPEPSDGGSEVEEVIFSHSSQPLDTIFVKQVRIGSPAYLAGLTTGDRIVHVNDYNVSDHTYQEIVTVIQRSEITLRLVVVPGQHDILQQVFGNTAHNPQSNLDLKHQTPSRILFGSVVTSVVSTGVGVSYQDTSPSTTLSDSFDESLRSKGSDQDGCSSPVITYQAFSSCVSTMPSLPAHRVSPHSVSGKPGTIESSPYGLGYSSRGHLHVKKKPMKDPLPKKNSPLVVDRKQAVYNISQGLKSVQKNKVSMNSVNSHSDNHRPSKHHSENLDARERDGVFEPVMVRIEMKGGIGERKKLEKDPDGRLYEVVQTRLLKSDFSMGPIKQPELNRPKKGLTLPVSNLTPKSVSFSSKAEGVRSNILYKTGGDYGNFDYNKSPSSDRSIQDAISRIKKNAEKKEEFLLRQNDLFSFPPRGAMVYRQYQVCPQKLTPRPIWPPTLDQSTESLDNENSPLSPLMEESHIRSMKKSIFLDSQALDPSRDGRPNSLPASPTNKDDQKQFFVSDSTINMPTSIQLSSVRPLVRNNIAKPYGSHVTVEEGHSKTSKPFFSTLSRIQENRPTDSSNSLPMSSCSRSRSGFGSESALSESRAMRSIPMAWVAENDRVKQLQIVSQRAKMFELGNQQNAERSPTKFELARLSQQDINVARRKAEFENEKPMTSRNELLKDKYGMPVSLEGILTYIGNRSNPVGGPKIHCEPPHKYLIAIPDKVLERNRSHSVCSHATLWKDRSSGSDLIRQHSFHNTIRSHIAQPPSGEFNPTSSDQSFVLECREGQSSPAEGTYPSFAQPTRPCLLDLKDRALPAANDPYSSYCSAGAVGTLQKVSTAPFDDAAKNDMPHADQTPTAHDKKPVSLRGRIWLGDDHERLVRRVSYLKATSTERVLNDSDVDSDDDKSSRHLSDKGTSAAEELPSPASFKASIVLHGHLNVKLARHRGKRAGDRSWKSVWGVIRGRALLFYKDKQVALQTPLGADDQVTLKDSEIGVATDYTKKKNVLRINTPVGSQFLLQAESEAAMTAWLSSLRSATAQVSASSKKDLRSSSTPTSSGNLPFPSAVVSSAEPISNMHNGSSSYVDSDNINRSLRKVTTPRRTRSPSGQVSVIKARKSTDAESSLKSKTWKVRIGRHLRKIQSGSGLNSPSTSLPHGASIGVCLDHCPPSSENDLIPLLVALCVGVVESKGLHIQGIYRIPGNKAAVNHLIEMVNQGPHAINLFDPRWSDVNVISSLLKQFFQKLPDPLIPSYLYCLFIDASKTEDPQRRIVALKNLVHELPDYHFDTLRYLISHFGRISAKSNQNKMDTKNLAIVFGPTLIRAADDNVAKMVTDMSHQCRIVESLIAYESWLFNEDEMDDPPPAIEDHSLLNDSGTISQMESNSQNLLLNNISKIEGTNKETNKMLSSLISAANRIHKNRGKKMDEFQVPHISDEYHSPELLENISINQRRAFRASLTPSLTTTDKIPASTLGGESSESVKKHSTEKIHKSNSVSMMPSRDFIHDDLSSRMDASYLGDEVAIRSYAGLSARTQERIRQFEMETRAMMLQRDILSRQESQKLESNRKKVEDQLLKAKQDMENEDIFDKMARNPSEIVPRISDMLAVAANRASNKEPVGFPSCSVTPQSNGPFLASSLTNSYAVATNSSVKVAKNSSRLFESYNKVDNAPCTLSQPDISHTFPYGTISSYNTLSSVHSGNSSGYGSLTRGGKPVSATDETIGARMTKSCYDETSLTRKEAAHNSDGRLVTCESSPHLSSKHRKPKKTSKKRSTSSVSRSARETILKHILPFHSNSSSKSNSLAESLIDSSTHQTSILTDQFNNPSTRTDLAPFSSRSHSHATEGARSDLHLPGLLALNDRYLNPESHENTPVKKTEGSDLLRDMTETFEEKMRCLQDSPFLTVDSFPTPNPTPYEELKRDSFSQEKENSLSILDAKSYRDPSLHIKRSPVDVDEIYNFAQAIPEMQTRSANLRRTESLSNSDRREKDKSEKRSRERHRIDTQEILREKKPKEMKRSKTQEIHYPIDLIENVGCDQKSRKQNVHQLKEKFERGTDPAIDPVKKTNGSGSRNGAKKKSRINRRHTVGGTKDLARVALLRVIEAQKVVPAPTWEQIQALVENITDKMYLNPTLFACDGSSPELNAILSLVAQQTEPMKRHLNVKDSTQKSLHAVLESHV